MDKNQIFVGIKELNKPKRSFLWFFSICCLATHLEAQSTAVTTAANAGQLPFLYLNQYFEYDIKSQDEIFLAGKTFNFANFKISVEGSKAEVELLLLKPWIMTNSSLIFKNKASALIQKVAVTKGNLNYTLLIPPQATSLCLVSNSRFSETEFCKSLVITKAEDFQVQVSADGEVLDKSGLVVLKDKVGVLNFSAVLSADQIVLLKTKKRNVLPISVKKLADVDTMTIVFRDQGLTEKNAWEEKINIDQSFVVLRLDPLVSVKQDLYFNESVSKQSPLSYSSTTVKAKSPLRIEENGITTEVFGVFSGSKASSPNLNVSLNSDLGKGIRSTYRWGISAKIRGFAQAQIYQINIFSDSLNSIKGTNQMPYAAAIGAEYQLQNRLSVLAQGRIHKDLFLQQSGASGVEIITGHNAEVAVAPTYQIYRSLDSKLSADLMGSYLYSSEAAGTSASGFKAQLGLSYIRRFEFGQFALSSRYGMRSQKFGEFEFTEQLVDYGLGYHYLF